MSAPASFLWSALADARRAHRAIFISTLLAGGLAHLALGAGRGFWAFVALAVGGEALGAPATLLADAAVMAAATDVSRPPSLLPPRCVAAVAYAQSCLQP